MRAISGLEAHDWNFVETLSGNEIIFAFSQNRMFKECRTKFSTDTHPVTSVSIAGLVWCTSDCCEIYLLPELDLFRHFARVGSLPMCNLAVEDEFGLVGSA